MPKEQKAKEQPAGAECASVSSKIYPDTKRKLRVLAAYHGCFAAQLLATLVDEAYERLGDKLPQL